jgi:hypothetical protein
MMEIVAEKREREVSLIGDHFSYKFPLVKHGSEI